MRNPSDWKLTVREALAEVIKQSDDIPRYEAMSVCGAFLEVLETAGPMTAEAVQSLLVSNSKSMKLDLLRECGTPDPAVDQFREAVVAAMHAMEAPVQIVEGAA